MKYFYGVDRYKKLIYSEIEQGFNTEPHLRALVLDLIDTCGATTFVETGTLHGVTCDWLAARRDIPILTCEVNKFCLDVSRKQCVSSIEIHEMSSEKFIPWVVNRVGDMPLFYLDAHSRPYWPLHDEFQAVCQWYDCAFILLHDVKIPDNPGFGCQRQGGFELDVDYIKAGLSSDCTYRLFLPNYVPNPKKQGYALLFQNIEPCGLCTTSDKYFEWRLE